MLPTEQFSGDAVPQTPWTPDVWSVGPDALVQKARIDLFTQRRDIEIDALGSNESVPAMDGESQMKNEAEELINPTPGTPFPDGQGRAQVWRENIKALYDTAPLAGAQVRAQGTPSPNPNA